MGKHYSTQELKKQILRQIMKKKLVFLNEIFRYITCSKNTVFDHNLNHDPEILEALNNNKLNIKSKLRDQWEDPKAHPNLQLGLYKILGTDDEREALGVLKPISNQQISINVNTIK